MLVLLLAGGGGRSSRPRGSQPELTVGGEGRGAWRGRVSRVPQDRGVVGPMVRYPGMINRHRQGWTLHPLGIRIPRGATTDPSNPLYGQTLAHPRRSAGGADEMRRCGCRGRHSKPRSSPKLPPSTPAGKESLLYSSTLVVAGGWRAAGPSLLASARLRYVSRCSKLPIAGSSLPLLKCPRVSAGQTRGAGPGWEEAGDAIPTQPPDPICAPPITAETLVCPLPTVHCPPHRDGG